MQILVKLPTRERFDKFRPLLLKYMETSWTSNVRYLITLDVDDPDKEKYVEFCEKMPRVEYKIGYSRSKIDACNRDMSDSGQWDICVLASDDMVPIVNGWDEILIKEMTEHFPDTDGILYHSDGFQERTNTMCILGCKYYNRFNYIYNPVYKSFYCDNEFQAVGDRLGRQKYFKECLFKHEHPANTGAENDKLYNKNNKLYDLDKKVYTIRSRNQFR